MASQIEIFNMALGNIGISETVASLEERSKSRIALSQYWQLALETTLAAFPWPFATTTQSLALLNTYVNGWTFEYQYPVDCLRGMYLTQPGNPMPMDETLQPRFETADGEDGRVIRTDLSVAQLCYVRRIEDTGRFPPMFTDALSWKLAEKIAMPLTNTRGMAETAAAAYKLAWQDAAAQALNESKFDTSFQSEFITVRGGF